MNNNNLHLVLVDFNLEIKRVQNYFATIHPDPSGQYIKICGEDSRRRLPRPLLEKLCLLETPLYLREILVEEPLEEGLGGTIFDSYLIWWIETL